jgi:hypothetical protein
MDFLNETSATEGTTKQVRWITLSNGKFVMKVDQNDTKAVSRINKLGNQVWERVFASIGPVNIKTLTIQENPYGEKNIYIGVENPAMKSDMDTVIIIKAESAYGRSFFQQIFHIDLTRLVVFNPWTKVSEDGKKATRLYINYTNKEKSGFGFPEGTPQVIFHQIKGKTIVDVVSQVSQQDFLEEKLIELSKANGLWREATKKAENSETFLGENVDTTPLTEAEIKSLNKLKKASNPTATATKAPIQEADDMDDLFDSI